MSDEIEEKEIQTTKQPIAHPKADEREAKYSYVMAINWKPTPQVELLLKRS